MFFQDELLTLEELKLLYEAKFCQPKPVIRFSSLPRQSRPQRCHTYIELKLVSYTPPASQRSGIIDLEIFSDLAPETSQFFLQRLKSLFLVINFADVSFYDRRSLYHGVDRMPQEEGVLLDAPFMVALEGADEDDGLELRICHPTRSDYKSGVIFARIDDGMEVLTSLELCHEAWRKADLHDTDVVVATAKVLGEDSEDDDDDSVDLQNV